MDWGAWNPDAATPNSGLATVADGVLPKRAGGKLGYGPFPGLVEGLDAEALPAEPKGLISIRLFDGTNKVFAGTDTTIEELASDNTWSSIATGLTLTSGDHWSFAHYGAYLLSTNTAEGIYAYNVQSPAGNNLVSGSPVARFIFPCNNVLFALDCDGDNRRMESSSYGNPLTWTGLGADGKTFTDGGALVGGADLSNGLGIILQESSASLVQFTPGGSALYRIDKIPDSLGCVGARTIVRVGGRVFYIAPDGVQMYQAGGAPQAIGAGKFDEWLFDQVAAEDLSAIDGVYDPVHRAVLWRVSSESLLGYSLLTNEPFTLPVETTALSRIASPGYLLDNMDADYPLLDSMDDSVPLDSRFWQGEAPSLAALNAAYKVSTFTGSPLAATLRTSTFNNPATGIVRRATPLSDASNSTLKLGTSDKLSADLTWGTANSKERDGSVPLRGRGLNIAFEEIIPSGATWSFATGVEYPLRSSGGPR